MLDDAPLEPVAVVRVLFVDGYQETLRVSLDTPFDDVLAVLRKHAAARVMSFCARSAFARACYAPHARASAQPHVARYVRAPADAERDTQISAAEASTTDAGAAGAAARYSAPIELLALKDDALSPLRSGAEVEAWLAPARHELAARRLHRVALGALHIEPVLVVASASNARHMSVRVETVCTETFTPRRLWRARNARECGVHASAYARLAPPPAPLPPPLPASVAGGDRTAVARILFDGCVVNAARVPVEAFEATAQALYDACWGNARGTFSGRVEWAAGATPPSTTATAGVAAAHERAQGARGLLLLSSTEQPGGGAAHRLLLRVAYRTDADDVLRTIASQADVLEFQLRCAWSVPGATRVAVALYVTVCAMYAVRTAPRAGDDGDDTAKDFVLALLPAVDAFPEWSHMRAAHILVRVYAHGAQPHDGSDALTHCCPSLVLVSASGALCTLSLPRAYVHAPSLELVDDDAVRTHMHASRAVCADVMAPHNGFATLRDARYAANALPMGALSYPTHALVAVLHDGHVGLAPPSPSSSSPPPPPTGDVPDAPPAAREAIVLLQYNAVRRVFFAFASHHARGNLSPHDPRAAAQHVVESESASVAPHGPSKKLVQNKKKRALKKKKRALARALCGDAPADVDAAHFVSVGDAAAAAAAVTVTDEASTSAQSSERELDDAAARADAAVRIAETRADSATVRAAPARAMAEPRRKTRLAPPQARPKVSETEMRLAAILEHLVVRVPSPPSVACAPASNAQMSRKKGRGARKRILRVAPSYHAATTEQGAARASSAVRTPTAPCTSVASPSSCAAAESPPRAAHTPSSSRDAPTQGADGALSSVPVTRDARDASDEIHAVGVAADTAVCATPPLQAYSDVAEQPTPSTPRAESTVASAVDANAAEQLSLSPCHLSALTCGASGVPDADDALLLCVDASPPCAEAVSPKHDSRATEGDRRPFVPIADATCVARESEAAHDGTGHDAQPPRASTHSASLVPLCVPHARRPVRQSLPALSQQQQQQQPHELAHAPLPHPQPPVLQNAPLFYQPPSILQPALLSQPAPPPPPPLPLPVLQHAPTPPQHFPAQQHVVPPWVCDAPMSYATWPHVDPQTMANAQFASAAFAYATADARTHHMAQAMLARMHYLEKREVEHCARAATMCQRLVRVQDRLTQSQAMVCRYELILSALRQGAPQ